MFWFNWIIRKNWNLMTFYQIFIFKNWLLLLSFYLISFAVFKNTFDPRYFLWILCDLWEYFEKCMLFCMFHLIIYWFFAIVKIAYSFQYKNSFELHINDWAEYASLLFSEALYVKVFDPMILPELAHIRISMTSVVDIWSQQRLKSIVTYSSQIITTL